MTFNFRVRFKNAPGALCFPMYRAAASGARARRAIYLFRTRAIDRKFGRDNHKFRQATHGIQEMDVHVRLDRVDKGRPLGCSAAIGIGSRQRSTVGNSPRLASSCCCSRALKVNHNRDKRPTPHRRSCRLIVSYVGYYRCRQPIPRASGASKQVLYDIRHVPSKASWAERTPAEHLRVIDE